MYQPSAPPEASDYTPESLGNHPSFTAIASAYLSAVSLPLFNYTDDGDPNVTSLSKTICVTVSKGSAGFSVIRLHYSGDLLET
jgi:hypothetical protein